MRKKTLILGASQSPYRYSYMAANRLQSAGYDVVLVGKQKTDFSGFTIQDSWPDDLSDVDTITMYLSPENQRSYYNKIATSGAKRLIFNPGSENSELDKIAKSAGIEVVIACTLVMLSTDQY